MRAAPAQPSKVFPPRPPLRALLPALAAALAALSTHPLQISAVSLPPINDGPSIEPDLTLPDSESGFGKQTHALSFKDVDSHSTEPMVIQAKESNDGSVDLRIQNHNNSDHVIPPETPRPQGIFGTAPDNHSSLSVTLVQPSTKWPPTRPDPAVACPGMWALPAVSCHCPLPRTVRCRGAQEGASVLPRLTLALRNSNVSVLDLALHNATSLPERSFAGLKLVGLVVSTANTLDIQDGAFSGTQDTLLALGLPNNGLTQVPQEAVRNLLNVRTLDISQNKITELPSFSFPPLPELRTLNLMGNNLDKLQANALQNLPMLKVLNLSQNKLSSSEVSVKSLFGLNRLEELYLQNNRFRGNINQKFITGPQNLRLLSLSHNNITSITANALSNFKELRQLDISHNQVDVIEDDAFASLPKLERLLMSHNNVVTLSSDSFKHLSSLHTLMFSYNSLLALDNYLLQHLSKLETLDLTHNDISSIENGVLKTSLLLRLLDLRGNPLACCALAWLRRWLTAARLSARAVCATPAALSGAELMDLSVADLECNGNFRDEIGDQHMESNFAASITSLKAERQPHRFLKVHAEISSASPCQYELALLSEEEIVSRHRLNCTASTFTFVHLKPSSYVVCATLLGPASSSTSTTGTSTDTLSSEALAQLSTGTSFRYNQSSVCTYPVYISIAARESYSGLIMTSTLLIVLCLSAFLGWWCWKKGNVFRRWNLRNTVKYSLHTDANSSPFVRLEDLSE